MAYMKMFDFQVMTKLCGSLCNATTGQEWSMRSTGKWNSVAGVFAVKLKYNL